MSDYQSWVKHSEVIGYVAWERERERYQHRKTAIWDVKVALRGGATLDLVLTGAELGELVESVESAACGATP